MMNNYIVYIHTNKTDGKRYVGITSQSPNRRWRNGNGYYENKHFYRAICRDGWENFTHEIVLAGVSKAEACEKEKELIAFYKTNDDQYGYNKSTGGESPNEGTAHSNETITKMREAHKGLVFSEEQKRNMSIAAKKRGNMRSGKIGEQCGKSGLVRQLDLATGELIAEYYGFYEMERATGFGQTSVKRVTKGMQRQSHGYKWEYIPRRLINVVV